MKKQVKKILLARETLRHLTAAEAAGVVGGTYPASDFNTCKCPHRDLLPLPLLIPPGAGRANGTSGICLATKEGLRAYPDAWHPLPLSTPFPSPSLPLAGIEPEDDNDQYDQFLRSPHESDRQSLDLG